MKKILSLLAALGMIISTTACTSQQQTSEETKADSSVSATQAGQENQDPSSDQKEFDYKYQKYATMSAEEIVASLTLEQKAAQMVQPAIYAIDTSMMQENCYGSVLSKINPETYLDWQQIIGDLQQSAVDSESGVPFVFGQDDVHGVNYASGTVIFPHNIGIGAANDPELTYQMGLATADEAKLCHMLWNFAPCVAQSEDPRWGRTYESYGSDLDIITSLSTSYTKGLVEGGVIACPKHFFGDGNVEYGTGEDSDVDRLMDRGDSVLTDEEIEKLLAVYQAQIDAGAQTIMISHSSINGVKMHENAKYIQLLKNEMGFKGFIVSDWNSIQNIPAESYEEQVVKSINAGIDMLMEPDSFDDARMIIVDSVNNGQIPQERVDDAVRRIVQVKLDQGIFDDPFCENITTNQTKTGSDEYRQLAEKLVEESLVLVKNENKVLPLKEGTSIYITGPAADDVVAQCGGWTLDWNSSPVSFIPGAKSILDGFQEVASAKNITVITDKKKAADADVVIVVVGEQSYAEWNGDTEDLQLCGALGLEGNKEAIEEAKKLGKPVVACVVAGRNVIIDDYYNDWDAVVMCYLPGSEAQGVANVLCGNADFKGKLPSPWYSSTDQIGTSESWLEKGYGLTYED